ncbi:unnamed protein product [Schistosoma mattheei]|uniref:Uncharacterized protein n=1 Tax=Schistosoma mattheei TaxID=31246 RepID=A0A183PDS9_9TREM|nr:unnamed protein product [Schistosoma mattheei]
MSCAVDIYDFGPHFKWITRNNVDMNEENNRHINNDNINYNQFMDSMRFTIQDLVQQESCIGSSNYPVDKPSRLVQIECRKPGCRCVLKNEHALAMKIVPGITLVQAEWLLPNSVVSNNEKSRLNHTSQHIVNNTSNNKNAYNQSLPNFNQIKSSCPHSVVLTSCCPSWFELVRRNVIGPSDNGPQICPEVPVWSSCKAVWRAKPKFFLLRKDTQCLFATNTQSLTMSSTELLKKDDRSTITLDADNIGILRPGTVLQLIDCRLCRLVHKEDQISYRLSARHRSKPVSMLQCAVVGGKALAALASSITNLSPQDALNWFSTGPRLVYLSLASKSIMCSPVKTTSTISVNNNYGNHNKNSSQIKLSGNETDYSIFDNGVHSILSLLSTYRLPLITRPVVGLRSSEWFFMGKCTNHSLISNPDSVNMHSLLQIFSCHHGDLIFLEPLSDCTKSVYQNESSNETIKSRFFVVTTDMLLHHNFLVADSQTCQAYQQQLEIHAFRVSHFLAACHPVQGLTYILKHLEDITHSSNTGPSYIPLTRTLGPITNRFNTIAIQSAISSIAAIASLTMHEESNDIPNDPYQLNEIQPKILNYLTLHNNNNNTVSTTTTTTTNYHNSSNYNSMHTSSIDINDSYHSANCLINTTNLHTQSSLSSSLFASEVDEMNALCDEIEDIYFYTTCSNNNNMNTDVLNNSTYDYGYNLSSSNHHSKRHLSLSSSHIHPSISRESNNSLGNVWTSSFSVNNNNNNKTSVSTTTNISKSYYFTSQDQPSSMTASFRHQSAQNSSSSIQPPPPMPLLYPSPVTTSQTSRLYQSTIISPSIDRKQITARPSYKHVTSTTNLDFGMHHNHSTIPSPLSTMLLLQSPKLKRTELTNSSPDTGIGIESTYDQQTTPCTGGSFMPLNAYHHSLSSSNMAVWLPSEQHCQQCNREDSITKPSTINNRNISYHSSPDKHFTSCKLTTFPVQNNHLMNSTMHITNTTNNHNSNRNQQYAYQF